MSCTLLDSQRRPYESEAKGRWGGHRGTRIYGRLDCPAARRAIDRGGYAGQRVFFSDETVAIAAGYRPCAVCCLSQYQDWRDEAR
jgi:methylphosphotriester-DNA--protein-cysteine methyltransferase